MADIIKTNALDADTSIAILNDEPHKCLRVTSQMPHWQKNVAGIEEGKICLPLYIVDLMNRNSNAFEAVGAGYRLKGNARKEFEEAQNKLMNLGIISDVSHAEAVVIKTPKHRTDGSDISSYDAYVTIDPKNVHLERLQDLRKKTTRAFESLKLMDSVFDLQNADVIIHAPKSPNDKLSIVYSSMTPDMFKAALDVPLIKDLGEKVEAQIGTYEGLPKGFPAMLAPLFINGVPTQTHGAMIIDGEDPTLKEKLLKLVIAKNMQQLTRENPEAAQQLLDDLSSKIGSSGQKQQPGSAKNHPRIGGKKGNSRIADIPSDNLPE